MRKPLWIYALFVLLVVGAAPQAFAQYDEDRPSKLNIRFGVYKPSGSKLRSEGGSMWKTFGFDYTVQFDQLGRPRGQFSLETAAESKGRFKGRLTSVQYTRYLHKTSRRPHGLYFGTGVGVFMASERLEATFFDPPEKVSGTKLGFSAVGGYDFNANWFAEVRYARIGKLAPDVDFSGLSLVIGARQLL